MHIKKYIIILASFLFIFAGFFVTAKAKQIPFKLEETSIAALQNAIKSRQITCTQVVMWYLTRIKNYNLDLSRGAPINAFVSINPNVMEDAQQLDNYFSKQKKLSGSLFCVPIVLKDNIDSYDSPSTSGSLALLGSQPIQDAFITAQLRQAGAIILGKASMDEFASGMNGISSRSGRAGNAYDPNKNAGGSSSGVAAAVSANFALAGIGTDNSGSVRIPAVFNGVDGLRPSTGLVSQRGIFPRGNLDGIAGPITRNIEDLATILTVIAKVDPKDIKTTTAHHINSYLPALKIDGLKNKRIGILVQVSKVKTFDATNARTMQIFNRGIAHLQQAGATIVSDIRLPRFNTDRQFNMAGEVEEINEYLAAFPSTRRNFRAICLSQRTHNFGTVQKCLQHMEKTAKRNSKIYKKVLAMFEYNRHYVETIMQQQHLDALLIPINAYGAATEDGSKVNTWRAPVASNAGLPGITLIAGYTQDATPMPVGMELVGKQYTEADLIAMAYAYEKNIGLRQIPHFKSTATSPLEKLSISQLNNLFTLIGWHSYQQILHKGEPQDLTASVFGKIVQQTLRNFS